RGRPGHHGVARVARRPQRVDDDEVEAAPRLQQHGPPQQRAAERDDLGVGREARQQPGPSQREAAGHDEGDDEAQG
ncbi:hypothetical protein FE81_14075, partial [Staphylococcus aureus]